MKKLIQLVLFRIVYQVSWVLDLKVWIVML